MSWTAHDPYKTNKKEAGNVIIGSIIIIILALSACGAIGWLVGFKP